MEPFIDGGLFELLFALGLIYMINYVFLKKYLLIFFSIVSIIAPVMLFFLKKSELFSFIAGLCIFNGVLLVLLLWKQRQTSPGKPLFDAGKLKERFLRKKNNDPLSSNIEPQVKDTVSKISVGS